MVYFTSVHPNPESHRVKEFIYSLLKSSGEPIEGVRSDLSTVVTSEIL